MAGRSSISLAFRLAKARPLAWLREEPDDPQGTAWPVSFSKPLSIGLTDGLFYREKMRAIHRVAPAGIEGRILEIGGGRSGLASILYPNADIVTL